MDEQGQRAELRERFLRFASALNGKEVKVSMYENTSVSGKVAAVKGDGSHILLSDMVTAIGKQEITALRTSDSVCVSVNFDDLLPSKMDAISLAITGHFKILVDAYVSDFLVDDHWQKVPPSWQQILENADNALWAKLLDPFAPVDVLPLSLLCLRQLYGRVVATRDGVRAPKEIPTFLPREVHAVENEDSFPKITSKDLLRVRVKDKKQHEIDRILSLLKILHRDEGGFDFAVDVGAGLGHLSRILAVEMPSVSVMTIEGNCKESNDIDNRVQKRLRSDVQMPQRVERFLDPKSADIFDEAPGERGVLLGLHPCGDLSPTILRSFIAFDKIRSLVLFGCCYHKLNGGTDKMFRQEWETNPEESHSLGFPLSTRYSEVSLSYAGRELACHAVEQFAQKLRENPEAEHRSHFYRALLEFALWRYSDGSNKYRHMPMKSVKNADELSFKEYAEKALRGQDDLQKGVLEQIDSDPEIHRALSSSSLLTRRVFSFYCIRLLLAPFVENLLVSDRLSFIHENGFPASSFSLFNPVNSPRNIVIVAVK